MRLGSKTDAELLRFLQRVPLFATLKGRRLESVIGASVERKYKTDQIIEKEGGMGIAFYLILDGRIAVRRGRRVLATMGKGQFFGEMALLDKQPRSADIVALEETRCLVITSWNWNGIMKGNPQIAPEMLRVLAGRLRETNKALTE